MASKSMLAWVVVSAFVLLMVAAHVAWSHAFSTSTLPKDLPILGFVAGLLAVSTAVLGLSVAVIRTALVSARYAFGAICVVGLLARLLLLAGTPVLEVDFNRYLWDGGLVAHGYNPYEIAPSRIAHLPYGDPRLELSKDAGAVFDGISYPHIKTIYPPVAQALFGAAHLLSPWSLTAWRVVALVGEIATFALIVILLREVGRSPLWSALYWWHPLVLKEALDSAHLEAVLMPFVLGAILATIRKRHATAVVLTGLAIGIKLWPIMLLPLVLRPLLAKPQALISALFGLAGLAVAYAAPVVLGGLDPSSGFVRFAAEWATNSAHVPLLESLLRGAFGFSDAGRVLRLVLALVVAGVAVRLALPSLRGAGDIVARAYWTGTVLLLLSPAQFPWYVLWVLPLAVVHGRAIGWFIAAGLMPIYYAAFHFHVRGDFVTHGAYLVWLIWIPTWVAMIYDVRVLRRASLQRDR